MATSGTLSPSGGYQGRKLSFSWSLARQSIEGNYSVISWSLSAVGGSSSYYYHHKEQLWVAGAWRYNNTNNTKRYKGTITSGSITIYHDDDGKGSFSAELYAAIYTAAQNQSGSASWSLPDIPRVSDISVNKSSVPADGSTTITATATKKSSSFTDVIVVELGDYSKTVTSGTAFTIPKTWINAIDGTAATATVTVTTKSGSTTIGSKSVNFTVTVPSTVVPSISSVAVSEAVTAVQTAFGSGVYVSSLSKLNVDITAAGIYGSTIESVKTTFDGITYTGAEFQTKALSKAGTLTMSVTVTDSRGRTKTTTKDITVYGYSAPVITNVSCVSSGTSTVVTVSGVVAPVAVSGSNKNTKTLKIKYKASTATTYGGETTVTIPAADWTFSVSKTFTLNSRNTTYDFEAKLSDKISTATEYGSTGKPAISFKAQAKGVTVGAEATEDGFVVANGWDAKFTGNVYIELDADTAALWEEVFGSGGGN